LFSFLKQESKTESILNIKIISYANSYTKTQKSMV